MLALLIILVLGRYDIIDDPGVWMLAMLESWLELIVWVLVLLK